MADGKWNQSIIQIIPSVQIFKQLFPFIHAFSFFKYLMNVLSNEFFTCFSFFTIRAILHCFLHVFFVRLAYQFGYAHFLIQTLGKFSTNAASWTSYAHFAKRKRFNG